MIFYYALHLKYTVRMKTQMNISSVIITLSLILLANSQFLPARLRIIDQNSKANNYLVRGNLPINQRKQFQIKQLKGNLSKLTGITKYKLIVYNLMNFLTAKETRNTYIEQTFFQQHPKEGIYRHKIVLGSLIDPSNMPSWASQIFLALSSIVDFDDMNDFLNGLRADLFGTQRNVIIYIHCSAGIDRTGYVAAAYKLRFLNYPLKNAINENIEVMAGLRSHMHFNTENGLKWFCHSLGKTKEECKIAK